ncbi:hypothetical protein [Cellulomonas sp. URHB0016]
MSIDVQPRTIRELLGDLAAEVARAGATRTHEAIDYYRRALDEPGDRPHATDLHAAIGDLLDRDGDPTGAFASYLSAVEENATLPQAASRAVALLERVPALSLDGATRARVAAAAAAPRASGAALHLAAWLRRSEGDLAGAAALLERAWERWDARGAPELTADLVDALLSVDRVGDADGVLEALGASAPPALVAEVRLAQGRLSEARASALQAGSQGVHLAALAELGLDDGGEHTEAASGSTPVTTPEGATATAIVVHLAAHGPEDYEKARRLFVDGDWGAATSPDVLAVFRAQLLFEGAGNTEPAGEGTVTVRTAFDAIDEGRKILRRIARRSAAPAALLHHRWLRRQRAVRMSDDRFTYAMAELVAALGQDPDATRAAVGACARRTTSYVQDAALDELLAQLAQSEAALGDDRSEPAAAAKEAAARAVDLTGLPARAYAHALSAVRFASSPARRLLLADIAWRASYDDAVPAAPTTDGSSQLGMLTTALELFDAERGEFDLDAGSEPAFVHGALRFRRAELASAAPSMSSRADAFGAVPGLLAAALVDGAPIWRVAHAAYALGEAGLRGSAWAVAVQASRLARSTSTDVGVAAECAATMGVNHLADRDAVEPELRAFAETETGRSAESARWMASVRFHLAVRTGRHDEAWALLRPSEPVPGEDSPPYDDDPPDMAAATWARWDRLSLRLLRDGIAAHTSRLSAFADDLRTSGDDQFMLAEQLRLLGDPAGSDTVLDGMEPELASDPNSALERQLNALARGDAGAEAALAALVGTVPSPAKLCELANVSLPLFAAAYAAARPAADRLRRLASERVDTLRSRPVSILEEVDRVALPDDVRAVVRQLLWHVESSGSASDADLVAWARRLGDLAVSGALAPALVAVRSGVERRLATSLAEQVTARAVAGEGADDLLKLLCGLPGWPEALATSVSTPASLWSVLDAVGTAVGPVLAERLSDRLHELLGITGLPVDVDTWTRAVPLAVRVGSGLTPHVDPDQGSTLIAEGIPRFQARVLAERGLRLPGIVLREGTELEDDELVVLVDDVPVHRARVDPDLPSVHDEILDAVERGVGPYLPRFVGPDDVADLVAEWRAADAAAVQAAVPEPDPPLMLTWVLQAGLHEGNDIADWRDVLHVITDAGGLEQPFATLAPAVTHGLRAARPPQSAVVTVPEVLLEPLRTDGGITPVAWQKLVGWLWNVVEGADEPVSIRVEDDTLRDTVAVIARSVSPDIATYRASEAPQR